MRTVHIIGSFATPNNPKYELDAHNIKIIKYSKLLYDNKYNVIYYGTDGCQQYISCNEYHPVIKLTEYDKISKITNNFTSPEYLMAGCEFDYEKTRLNLLFSENARKILFKNYKDGDFVLHFYCNDLFLGCINVRMSHGGGYWKNYNHVSFETESFMIDEFRNGHNLTTAGVIHPWFDHLDFCYNPSNKYKTPTFLFMARCIMFKGIHYFLKFSKEFPDYNFIIAGGTIQYDNNTGIMNIGSLGVEKDNYICIHDYPNVKYVGPVFGDQKKELLSRSTALIQPTEYFEPCGWNVLEAMVSGTPVLVPHFGGFRDTVIDGVTGYFCRPNDWIKNMNRVQKLQPINCRNHVIKNFNKDKAILSIDKFLNNVALRYNQCVSHY